MKKFAIILAGGEGRRAGGSIPKQMADLNGRPVLWWSMRHFLDSDPSVKIILVMHPGLFDDWDAVLASLPQQDRIPHELCCGGRDRTESVRNALISLRMLLEEENISAGEAIVAVHDAARPLASPELISRGWNVAAPGCVAVPVVPCSSSLRRLVDNCPSLPVDRSLFVEVQTPQIAVAADMFKAYANESLESFTDDASLLQADGIEPVLYDGAPSNMKITYPDDLSIASVLLKDRK